MITTWEFPIKVEDEQTLRMPKGAQAIAVQVQGMNGPCLWAIVEPHKPLEDRVIITYGTGQPMQEDPSFTQEYISTYQIGYKVFHVFAKHVKDGWG